MKLKPKKRKSITGKLLLSLPLIFTGATLICSNNLTYAEQKTQI